MLYLHIHAHAQLCTRTPPIHTHTGSKGFLQLERTAWHTAGTAARWRGGGLSHVLSNTRLECYSVWSAWSNLFPFRSFLKSPLLTEAFLTSLPKFHSVRNISYPHPCFIFSPWTLTLSNTHLYIFFLCFVDSLVKPMRAKFFVYFIIPPVPDRYSVYKY